MELRNELLFGYGLWLLARQLGQPLPVDLFPDGIEPLLNHPLVERVRAVIGDGASSTSVGALLPLTTIFSSIAFVDGTVPTPRVRAPLRVLNSDLRQNAQQLTSAPTLWEAFLGDVRRLPTGWGRFETFCALMARYGWYVRGTLMLNDISVYEQFKAVVALAHTLADEDDTLLLVEIDLVGIQEMLYTISSKGAAKDLRGRSAYLQLLTETIGRAILRQLQLPAACLVSAGGGNQLLLTSIQQAEQLEQLRDTINQHLFTLHRGELVLALDWTPLSARALTGSGYASAREILAMQIGIQKTRAFSNLADQQDLFAPNGAGSDRFCRVCQVDLAITPLPHRRADSPEGPICDQCASFGDGHGRGLARLIADTGRQGALVIIDYGAIQSSFQANWDGKPSWEHVMRVFGYRYQFESGYDYQFDVAAEQRNSARTTIYRLNQTDGLPRDLNNERAYGFRWQPNLTPRVRADEVHAFNTWLSQRVVSDDTSEDERLVAANDIRSTLLMARRDRTGVDRYGVLRMDIDDLGTILSKRLIDTCVVRVSALSAALNLFFECWLNTLCDNAASDWQTRLATGQAADNPNQPPPALSQTKQPYLLYAGGDDLLLVGVWDVLPHIARQIRRELDSYVQHGFVDLSTTTVGQITMSAGIFAEGEKFPLYQAVHQAGVLLNAAKRRRGRRRVDGQMQLVVVKDAITLLERTLGWAEFDAAEQLVRQLVDLLLVGEQVEVPGMRPRHTKVPHSLLELLGETADSYLRDGGDQTDERLVYGRWMPMLAYGLRQCADRLPLSNNKLRRGVLGLAGDVLDLTTTIGAAQWPMVRYLGLPVRWCELLIRKGGERDRTATSDDLAS
ncbi:MAG: type III-A CRISPR-associated protein Cas10/Csm1 [Roseiflexaceae bacterium]|nr:type III-A CRISPR-associated protein Cas10/Csm1 [Roseiflexaceae bacterium]